jgi:hypothetical protein
MRIASSLLPNDAPRFSGLAPLVTSGRAALNTIAACVEFGKYRQFARAPVSDHCRPAVQIGHHRDASAPRLLWATKMLPPLSTRSAMI